MNIWEMILDYSDMGNIKVDMRYYVKAMVEDLASEYEKFHKNNKKAVTPNTGALFNVDDSPVLYDK